MTIDSFDIVFYTATLILPGFIISNIVDIANPTREKSDAVLAIRYLGYSLVNCACLSWVYKMLLRLQPEHPIAFWLSTK